MTCGPVSSNTLVCVVCQCYMCWIYSRQQCIQISALHRAIAAQGRIFSFAVCPSMLVASYRFCPITVHFVKLLGDMNNIRVFPAVTTGIAFVQCLPLRPAA